MAIIAKLSQCFKLKQQQQQQQKLMHDNGAGERASERFATLRDSNFVFKSNPLAH